MRPHHTRKAGSRKLQEDRNHSRSSSPAPSTWEGAWLVCVEWVCECSGLFPDWVQESTGNNFPFRKPKYGSLTSRRQTVWGGGLKRGCGLAEGSRVHASPEPWHPSKSSDFATPHQPAEFKAIKNYFKVFWLRMWSCSGLSPVTCQPLEFPLWNPALPPFTAEYPSTCLTSRLCSTQAQAWQPTRKHTVADLEMNKYL